MCIDLGSSEDNPMSAFHDLAVKFEMEKLGHRHHMLPTVERGPYVRQQSDNISALRIKYIVLFSIFSILLNYDFGLLASQSYLVRRLTPEGNFLVTLVVGGLMWLAYSFAFRRKADVVAEEIIAGRTAKAARLAEEAEKQAAVAAEEARQRALAELAQRRAVEEQERAQAWASAEAQRQQDMQRERAQNEVKHREQAVFAFRTSALKQMEEGLKQVLFDYRKRLEWVPESASEEHLYKKIRMRIKQADVPEFGILRRSTDLTVTMVLGDRSCLPDEPSDEVLARRQLPPVFELLS